jgi:hypothetical protein
VNGLFRQLHGKGAALLADGTLNSLSPHPVVIWQFPVLAKYRFTVGKLNPFWEAGPSFRTAGNLNSSEPSHHGLTAGAGIEMDWGSWRVAPTARYTRWARDNILGRGARTGPNQVELLVAFRRVTESSSRPLGEHISLGVMLGTSITGDFKNTTQILDTPTVLIGSSGPRNLVVGPMVEFEFPHRLSVEVDALYRRISSSRELVTADATQRRIDRFVTWEFPVLAKYHFPVGRVRSFIGIGPSFRRPQALTAASPYGITFAAGVELRPVWHLRIAPGIRYTHWGRDDENSFSGARRNQSEVLVGFFF